jgi:hypothetical protein
MQEAICFLANSRPLPWGRLMQVKTWKKCWKQGKDGQNKYKTYHKRQVQSAAKLKHIEPNKKTNEVDSWATIFSESEKRIEKT